MSKVKKTEYKKIGFLGEALKERLAGKGDPRKPLRYPNNRRPDLTPLKKGETFSSTALDDYFI